MKISFSGMSAFFIFFAATCLLHLSGRVALPFSETTESFIIHVENPSPPSEPAEPKEKSNGDGNDKATIQSPNITLKLALMADLRLFPYDIEYDIQEKTVELKGVVAFEEEKILAALLTADLMKGKNILNHLEVSPALQGTLQAKSDARLTALVKQRFANSKTLHEANFEIITIRGIVSLRGRTRYQVIALEAAQAAREIPGVLAVNTQHIRLEGEND